MVTILREKNSDSAISFIQHALQKLPTSISLHIGLARGFQQKGQLDKALTVCEQIIQQLPNQLDALVLKSEILKDLNKTAESLATLETAYSLAPSDKDLAYDLAFEYADAKNSKALKLTDLLSKFDSTETVARAYYIRATYFKNIGNNIEALKNYDAAIIKDYNFLDVYLDKGELLYNQKKYDAAMANFQKALNISPSTADFFYWIGKVQEATGKTADAKLNYQRAYGLDKSLTEAKQAAERL
jgi:tetratricopeptide (TPR) repeat protein